MVCLTKICGRIFSFMAETHLTRHPTLFIIPIVGWGIWFTKIIQNQLWFSSSAASTTLALVNNFPIVIKKLYGSSHTYEDLTVKYYIERKLAQHEDQVTVQRQYEGAFMIIATWVLTLSTFGLVYMELFKFDQLPYTWAQIWSIISGAIAGVNMVQSIILRTTLSRLVKRQRRKFERMFRDSKSSTSLVTIELVNV